ncbi:DUF1839 family protein, partial [Rhizobium ruizarguesonis]
IEMDSFYMPDTRGTAYRQEHGKTTVAINRLDVAAKRVDYFHNAGYFRLEGEDFDQAKAGPRDLNLDMAFDTVVDGKIGRT